MKSYTPMSRGYPYNWQPTQIAPRNLGTLAVEGRSDTLDRGIRDRYTGAVNQRHF